MTTAIVADLVPVVCEGLLHVLRDESFDILAKTYSAEYALEHVRRHKPDLLITEVLFGKTTGLTLLEEVRKESPTTAILILSSASESAFAVRAMRAGANGFVSKNESIETIVSAAKTVAAGGAYVSPRLASMMAESLRSEVADPVQTLSEREFDVFRLFGHGLSTKEIASKLFISIKTVESHRAKIGKKLKLDSMIGIVSTAAKWLALSEMLGADHCERR